MEFNDFPLKTYDKIRYCDTDRQGHVNNSNFATFLETGRTELLYLYNEEPLHDDDGTFVIARQELNLIAEIRWPGTVEIGTTVSKIGNSSIGLYQRLFQNQKLVAEANTVIVHVDIESKKSKVLSDKSREILNRFVREN
ncbi:MAG: acyl-CoA thioesterase [Clostridia bacterium]|nr:acyl-CoA thioesterase [Clostridia bacterium]